MNKTILLAALLLLLTGCVRKAEVPSQFERSEALPSLYPDYVGVTVPCNICPLNFGVKEAGQQVVARFSAGDLAYTYGEGRNVFIDEEEWAELLRAACGDSIGVEVFICNDGTWKAFQPFSIYVSKDSIDPYISYRLIQPSYVSYNELSIRQRNLSSFDESVIYTNRDVMTQHEGQCINCHSYQNYGTQNMLFHMRQHLGGTMIVREGKPVKVDLKSDSTLSAGVYPSWHPRLPLVAFSTNLTGQVFHTKSTDKVEVQDTQSDLILYDVEKNEIHPIFHTDSILEIFPCWAPDGTTLYYGAARSVITSMDSLDDQTIERYKEIKYDIFAIDFNAEQRTFSEPRLVYSASELGQSATLPRLSPDGRFMVFAQADHGCFHVWHHDADIYLLDLQADSTAAVPLVGINSNCSESYPSFSSNGCWVMTASRRDDGNYTRPYIAHFDAATGTCSKAFELPQQHPSFYTFCTRSFNRSEFMKEPVVVTQQQFAAHLHPERRRPAPPRHQAGQLPARSTAA